MKLSIIIPLYNSQKYIRTTIESVLQQTYPHWELILVNDGSTDNTRDIVEPYVRKYRSISYYEKDNGGIADARNFGLTSLNSESESVMFLDHDDCLVPDAIETLIEAWYHNTGMIGAHGMQSFIDADGKRYRGTDGEIWSMDRHAVIKGKLTALPVSSPTSFPSSAYHNCMASPGVAIIHKRYIQKTGFFDQDMTPCDDWDYWLRLLELGNISFLNKVTLLHRRHEDNISNDVVTMDLATKKVRRKHRSSMIFSSEHRRIMTYSSRFWFQNLARTQWRQARAELTVGHIIRSMKHVTHAISHTQSSWGIY